VNTSATCAPVDDGLAIAADQLAVAEVPTKSTRQPRPSAGTGKRKLPFAPVALPRSPRAPSAGFIG
jgi:hypothetical protein